MRTADIKYINLCDEIDYWKDQAKYWEAECKQAQKEHYKSINHSIDESKKCIGVMLNAVLDPKSSINKRLEVSE